MEIHLFDNKTDMGTAAAVQAAGVIRKAVSGNGSANIILATGASQFEMLSALVVQDIEWSKVSVFHLDEYIGLPISHPASFRGYLQERFVARVPGLKAFHEVNGECGDAGEECRRLGGLIEQVDIDVACIGIGENGHLAFNDPPADFDTKEPFIVVELDEACRAQQVGEGWFRSMKEVPVRAISMSISRIMKAKSIVCTVPDRRKAKALKMTVEGSVTNTVPASILQEHGDCHIFADNAAGSLLSSTV